MKKKWCYYQTENLDDPQKASWLCSAGGPEDEPVKCPYKNALESKRALRPCGNYMPYKK